MSESDILVIQVVDNQPINHPVTYSNFLLLFPQCPRQDEPTNEILSAYGYQRFIRTPRPIPGVFEHPAIYGGYVLVGDVWIDHWIPVPFTPEEVQVRTEQEWEMVRMKRDGYLRRCDWTMVEDAPISAEEKQLWLVYRQILRDLPENTIDPFNPTWPIAPRNNEPNLPKFILNR